METPSSSSSGKKKESVGDFRMAAAQQLLEGNIDDKQRHALKQALKDQFGIEWNETDPEGSLELVAAKVRESRWLAAEKRKQAEMQQTNTDASETKRIMQEISAPKKGKAAIMFTPEESAEIARRLGKKGN
jgi:hypothetical protein